MSNSDQTSFTIIGAGLAGALLATLLAQRGWRVEVFEKRGDPRQRGYEGGRSINLALAERGLHALRAAGAADAVMQQAVMMRGRMVHFADGHQQLQRYGTDDSEVIWSVSRGELNIILLDAAEAAGATLHFDRRLASRRHSMRAARTSSTTATARPMCMRSRPCSARTAPAPHCAPRSGSRHDLGERFEPLGHSYKELEIPPGEDGGFRIEPNALHIWPRGAYMCIALPNDEKTFTVTLFLPNEVLPTHDGSRTCPVSPPSAPAPMRAPCSNATSPMRCR